MIQTIIFNIYAKNLEEAIKVFGGTIEKFRESTGILGIGPHLYKVTLTKKVNPKYEEKMHGRSMEGT